MAAAAAANTKLQPEYAKNAAKNLHWKQKTPITGKHQTEVKSQRIKISIPISETLEFKTLNIFHCHN